jgi:hypothetical protein
MKHSPLAIIFLISLSIICRAQVGEDLTGAQFLRNVRSVYDQGRLHEIPNGLEERIKVREGAKAFSQSEKVEAYKILILTYIYLEEPQKADAKMIELLRTDHFFEVAESDPVEFKSLYKKFRVKPLFMIGGKFGINQTQVNTIKNYYVLAESQGKGTYSSSIALQYGASFEKVLFGQFAIKPEVYYASASVTYNNNSIYRNDPSATETGTDRTGSVSHKITQQRISAHLLAQYTIGETKSLNRKLTPYIMAGPNIGYLMKSSFEGQHNLESRDNVTGEVIDNTSRYNPLTISLVAGAGASYKIGGLYLSGDVRYDYGLFNIVNDKNRYNEDTPETQKLIRHYAYVDNDFSLRQIIVTVGLIYPVFSPKKLIK